MLPCPSSRHDPGRWSASASPLAYAMYLRQRVPVVAPVGSPLTRAARSDLYEDASTRRCSCGPASTSPGRWCTWTTAASTVPSTVWRRCFGGTSGRLRRLQTGFVRSYALSMFGGAAVLVGAVLLVRL